MRTWAVTALKGGVGKTTTVVNLGGALAKRGQRTVMVDLDPHASLSAYFRIDGDAASASVHDLFAASMDGGKACAALALPRPTAIEGLDLIPSATALVTLERRCGNAKGMGRVLAVELPRLAERYDYCLLDCPPTLGLLVINAFAAAESLVVPLQTEDLALRSLDRLLRTLELFGKASGRQLAHLVVPTLFDRRTRASRDSLLALRCRNDISLWQDYIPVDTQLREASRLGLPLTCWQPTARASEAYERLLDVLVRQRPQHLRLVG